MVQNKMENEMDYIDELLEGVISLSNEAIQKYSSIDNELDHYIDNTQHYMHNKLDILNMFNRFPLKGNEAKCVQNAEFLNKLKVEVEDLKKKAKELEDKKAVEEENANVVEQKIIHLKAKNEHLQKKRDAIMVYKLLTHTNFLYDFKNVKGYVIGDTPDNIKCFDLNIQKYSPEQITEKLYSTIKAVSEKLYTPQHEDGH